MPRNCRIGLLLLVAAGALAVWTFRVQIAEALLLLTLGRAYMHKHLGVKRRPRSSWSSLGRTAAMLFAAWNSRWLKGVAANVAVPARAVTTPDVHDFGPAYERDGIPYA